MELEELEEIISKNRSVEDSETIAKMIINAGYRKACFLYEQIIKLIDENTAWFNDGFSATYSIPMLRKEQIAKLKSDIGILLFSTGEQR